MLPVKLVFDGFPLFFAQSRVGYQGSDFKIVKFRTMVVDREAIRRHLSSQVGFQQISLDSEIYTTLGRVFEKIQLVECPQLLNVLVGDMNIFGYRPLPMSVIEDLKSKGIDRSEVHHSCKPGILGVVQAVRKYGMGNRRRVCLETLEARLLSRSCAVAYWKYCLTVAVLVGLGLIGLKSRVIRKWMLRQLMRFA